MKKLLILVTAIIVLFSAGPVAFAGTPDPEIKDVTPEEKRNDHNLYSKSVFQAQKNRNHSHFLPIINIRPA